MRNRNKKNSPIRNQSDRFWREDYAEFFKKSRSLGVTYKEDTPPKRKRHKFYVRDYSWQDERHSGREWDQIFHERPFRRRYKRWIQIVTAELKGWSLVYVSPLRQMECYEYCYAPLSDGLLPPKHRRPYVYSY